MNKKFRITKLAWLLMTLMVLELGLVLSLRRLGWFGTGDMMMLVVSSVAFCLPIAIILLLLVINRFRIGLRGMLVFVTLIALLISFSIKPMLDFRDQRRGTIALLQADARVTTEEFHQHSLTSRSPTYNNEPLAIAEPELWLPPWLNYFVRDIAQVIPDVMAVSIQVDSDIQFEVLAENIHRFPNLNKIHFAALSDAVFYRIPEFVTKQPSIGLVSLRNPPLDERFFSTDWKIESLAVTFWFNQEAEFVELDRFIEFLIQQENLKTVWIGLHNTTIDESKIRKLAESKSLERVNLTSYQRIGRNFTHSEESFDLDEFRKP